jgi:hypothetical protein
MKTDTRLKELAEHIGISGFALFQILQRDLKMHNSGCCINLEEFIYKSNIMLNCVVLMGEMWARLYELELKCQSSEGCHPVIMKTRFDKICHPQSR